MKLVVAIIRPEKVSEVLVALYRIEVRGITVHARARPRPLKEIRSRPIVAPRKDGFTIRCA